MPVSKKKTVAFGGFLIVVCLFPKPVLEEFDCVKVKSWAILF
jgi:hypothetical protein